MPIHRTKTAKALQEIFNLTANNYASGFGSHLKGIQCLVDRCQFSGNYSYNDFAKIIPNLRPNNDKSVGKNKPYKNRYSAPLAEGGYMLLRTNINKGMTGRPLSTIEIIPKTEMTLSLLMPFIENFPDLLISEIEYAFDIYPDKVGGLFELIISHLYLPHQRTLDKHQKIIAYGPGTWEEMQEKNASNRSFYYGPEFKAYERGEDQGKEEGGGWKREKIDCIRMERTIVRRKEVLLGFDKITDLLQGPKFQEAHFNKAGDFIYRFSSFKLSSRKLPSLAQPNEWKPFPWLEKGVKKLIRDEQKPKSWNVISFQEKLLLARECKVVTNPNQSMEEVRGMAWLLEAMKAAMELYEAEGWFI